MMTMKEMLNKGSSIPLYYQIKEVIKEKIKSEQWKEDDRLPNELELAELFQVSRATIRQAVLELVNEGLLTRVKGRGTFIKKVQYEGDFMSFSYPEEIGEKHVPIKTGIIEGPLEYLHTLKLYNTNKINEIIRLRYFKEDPAIIENTYLPLHIFPDILNTNLEKSLYDTMIDIYKVNINKHKVYVEPILLNDYEANLLKTNPGEPALKTTKICETLNEVPVMLTISIFRKDKCKFFFKHEDF